MPRRPSDRRVGALSDLVRENRVLYLDCQGIGCSHRSPRLDPAELIARHGDMALQRFLERSRCSACGSREIGLIAPPGPGTPGVPPGEP